MSTPSAISRGSRTQSTSKISDENQQHLRVSQVASTRIQTPTVLQRKSFPHCSPCSSGHVTWSGLDQGQGDDFSPSWRCQIVPERTVSAPPNRVRHDQVERSCEEEPDSPVIEASDTHPRMSVRLFVRTDFGVELVLGSGVGSIGTEEECKCEDSST